MQQLTTDEVLALPLTHDLPTLGRILGVSEPVIRERHRRGEVDALGIRVIRVGAKYRVITSTVWDVLGITPNTSNGAGPASGPTPLQNAAASREVEGTSS